MGTWPDTNRLELGQWLNLAVIRVERCGGKYEAIRIGGVLESVPCMALPLSRDFTARFTPWLVRATEVPPAATAVTSLDFKGFFNRG